VLYVVLKMDTTSKLQLGALCVILALTSCRPNEAMTEQVPDSATRIDSEISVDLVSSIGEKSTVREFLLSLNLYEREDVPEDVLDDELLTLLRFEGRENIVNEWALAGGGGIRFTTRYNLEDAKQGGGSYSVLVMDEVVTSFDYAINGAIFSARLRGDQYVFDEP
jgi:hypothetical protein